MSNYVSRDAMEAAKTAMETVTPPPGVDRSDWLKEHGRWALLAGAIAAAAPHIVAITANHIADGMESWAGDAERGFVQGFAEAATAEAMGE